MATGPLVLLVGDSVPETGAVSGEPPVALRASGSGGAPLLDKWWAALDAAGLADPSSVFVATNASYYKFFEFWAIGKGLALPHVINSGRSVGDARVNVHDLAQALRLAHKQAGPASDGRGVLVVVGDAAPQPLEAFSGALRALAAGGSSAAAGSADAEAAAFYLSPTDAAAVRDPAVVATIAASAVAPAASAAAASDSGEPPVVPLSAVLAHLGGGVRVVPLPAGVAAAGPAAAAAACPPAVPPAGTIHKRAFARVGLLGNPTDGYGGKTVSVTLSNFVAEAWLTPLPPGDGRVVLTPHPLYDPMAFANARQLSTIATREGYSGGVRLMAATINRFYAHAASVGAALPLDRGFALRYHTTIPRQVGLAGSSALVTAMLRALLAFYGYGTEAGAASIGLSRDRLASFVLKIETEELGITAGLQDRVVQAYEGLVHMDFTLPVLKANDGMGVYTRLPAAALPPLFLAYAADPSDSGRIHAPVKQRWLAGDKEVVDGMNRIAALADDALALCTQRPYGAASSVAEKEDIVHAWAAAMRTNFDTRRQLFGDGALGRDNIRMVEISREVGASGKFPGSGGAIVGVVDVAGIAAAGRLPAGTPAAPGPGASPEEAARVAAARVAAATGALRDAYHAEGYVFVRLQPRETPADQLE